MSSSAMDLVISKPSNKCSDLMATTSEKDIAISWLMDNMGILDDIIKGYKKDDSTNKQVTCVGLCSMITQLSSNVNKICVVLNDSSKDSEYRSILLFTQNLPSPEIINRLKFIYPKSLEHSIRDGDVSSPLIYEFTYIHHYYNDEVCCTDELFYEPYSEAMTFKIYKEQLLKEILLLKKYVSCMNFWERRASKEEVNAIKKIEKAYNLAFL